MRRVLILIKGTWANWTNENIIAESLINAGWRVIAVTPIGSVFPDYYIVVEVHNTYSDAQILQQLRYDLSWYQFKSAEIVTVDLPANYDPNAPIVGSGSPTKDLVYGWDFSEVPLPDPTSAAIGAGTMVAILFLVLFLTKK